MEIALFIKEVSLQELFVKEGNQDQVEMNFKEEKYLKLMVF